MFDGLAWPMVEIAAIFRADGLVENAIDKAYRRRVSPGERIWLASNALARCNVEGVVEGDGELDGGAVQRAVDAAAEMNPGLRVRLRGRLGFCRWVDSGVAPPVRVVNDSRWDGRSEQHAAFLDRFSPLDGGAIADVVVLPGRPTRIVFRALHAAVDGGGLVHWMHEVFRALRGEPLHGAPATINDYAFAQQHRAKIDYRRGRNVACIPVLPQPDRIPEGKTMRYVWQREDFDGAHSRMLFKMAVFLGNYAHRFQAGPVRFTIPVDWRGLRKAASNTGNLCGYIVLPYEPGDSPRDFAERLHGLVRQHADCDTLPSFRIVPWLPLQWLRTILVRLIPSHFKPGKLVTSAGIVSMGTIALENACCQGFQATRTYGLPPLVGRMSVMIASNPDKVVAVIAVPEPFNDDGQLARMIKALKEYLDSV